MAKNVKITEDGSTKIIENATRIRTSLEGGGTCDWIPKDDVPLQELTVTEDGVYKPEEGYYGFSQVTANGVGNVVEGDLIEKTVTKNGTYNITDESGSPYGYSKIIVNVDTSEDDSDSGGGGGSPVVGKDEDGNDNMVEEDDDGNIVMTALPTEIKVIIPPTKLEYNRYEEIDYNGISVYAYISKAVHWLGTATTAVSEGSSNNTVSIGGNSVTASVGDGVLYAPDRTGTNDVQLVWDGTKWVKPSNYSAEKAIWKSDKYETGKIPFDELIFPIKRINQNDTIDKDYKIDIKSSPYGKLVVYNNFNVSFVVTCTYNNFSHAPDTQYTQIANYSIKQSMNGNETTNIQDLCVCVFRNILDSYYVGRVIESGGTATEVPLASYDYDNTPLTIIIAYRDRPGRIYIERVNERAIKTYNPQSPAYHLYYGELETVTSYHQWDSDYITMNGKTAYFSVVDINRTAGIADSNINTFYNASCSDVIPYTITADKPHNFSAGLAAWHMLYGDDELDIDDNKLWMPISLPVQWKRPGDGKILETTFTAWMKDDGGDGETPDSGGGDQ